MREIIYTNARGVIMERVSKRTARRLYDEGKPVLILGNNTNPLGCMGAPASTGATREDEFGTTFDYLCSSALNYISHELGRYLSFYVSRRYL